MEYHKNTEKISKSGLDLIHKSPLHYWDRYLNPAAEERKTPALLLGSAVHCAVLEPSEFGKRYAIAPEVDKRTKEGKEIHASFLEFTEGRYEVISKADSVICERIMEAINKHDEASLLMSKITDVEKIIEVDDLKCRPDAIIGPLNLIIDLKTTDDASPKAFGRSALKYRYDVQAAFYIDLYEKHYNCKCEGFIFIAVEKTAPFGVGVYVIEDEDIEFGRQKYKADLERWREAKANNKWTGYTGINKLEMPNYGK
jgi:exodeoxyribonuclease VIII